MMGYVRKVLLPGETLVYETGLHWLIYGRAILLLGAAALLAVWGAVVGGAAALRDAQGPSWPQIVLALAALLAILGVIAFIIAAIRRASTELAVTDQRVIFKTGIVARHTIEMNRSKVESVDVDQSILGRILGYGTVLLRGTGGSLEPMQAISDPLVFRSHITVDPVRHAQA
jgi:uncharacterized membrane protein YdbT with pleckstrin-like domain